MAIPTTVKTYDLDGTNKDFTISFEYLARKFVAVTLVGTTRRELVVNTDYRFTTPTTITTNVAWGPGDGYERIELRRVTSATDRLVDFADGSILRAYDLNIAQIQSLHIAEEARDVIVDVIAVDSEGNLDARGRKVVNVADGVNPGDAVTIRQMNAWDGSAANSAANALVSANNAASSANAAAWYSSSAATSANNAKASEDASKAYAESLGVIPQVTVKATGLAVVDLHWAIQKGTGWLPSETGGVLSTTRISGGSRGSIEAVFTTNVGFVAGQLICYPDAAGKYWTNTIYSITGSAGNYTVKFGSALEEAISTVMYCFHRDDAHGNTQAAYAVVDYSMRQLADRRLESLVFVNTEGAFWTAAPGSDFVLSSLSSETYNNPGNTSFKMRAIKVDSSAGINYVISEPFEVGAGEFRVETIVNIGTRTGGFSGVVHMAVQEIDSEGLVTTIAISDPAVSRGYGGTVPISVVIAKRSTSRLQLRIHTLNSGPLSFAVGSTRVMKLGDRLLNVNRGKHILFGDSWFTSGGEIHTAFINRLNKATVISAGIPGNTSQQMIDRFYADVASQKPDFIWIMVSTNDYYQMVTYKAFQTNILRLITMCQSTGAQVILFNSTVGSIMPHTTIPQLAKSREYSCRVEYLPWLNQHNDRCESEVFAQGISLSAGAEAVVWLGHGSTRRGALLRGLSISHPTMEIRIGFASSSDGAGVVEETVLVGSATYNYAIANRSGDFGLRKVCIKIKNPTGTTTGPIAFTGRVSWERDIQ